MTPESLAALESLATELEGMADAASRAGKHEEAFRLLRRVLVVRSAVDELRRLRALPRREYSPKVRGDMNDAHREAISKGRTKSGPSSPMMRAARKAGVAKTQAELAAAIGLKPNFLSAIVHGDKKMPPGAVEKLYALTGYRWED